MNASTWSSPNWSTSPRTGRMTAIAAPSAAPEAVPSTYGSASGFRSRPWNVAPATASPVPTTIAVRTRGSRRSITIASAVGGPGRCRGRSRGRAWRGSRPCRGREVHAPEHDPRHEHDAQRDDARDREPAGAAQPSHPGAQRRAARGRRPGAGSSLIGRRARVRGPPRAARGPGGSPARAHGCRRRAAAPGGSR